MDVFVLVSFYVAIAIYGGQSVLPVAVTLNLRYGSNRFILGRKAHQAFALASVPCENWIVVETVFGTALGYKLIQVGWS